MWWPRKFKTIFFPYKPYSDNYEHKKEMNQIDPAVFKWLLLSISFEFRLSSFLGALYYSFVYHTWVLFHSICRVSTHAYFYHLYRFCSEYFPPHSSTTIIHLFSLNYIGLSSLDDRCSNDKLQFVDKFVNGSLMHLLSRNNFRVSQTYTSSLSHCKLGTSVQHECTYVVPKHALRIIAAII